MSNRVTVTINDHIAEVALSRPEKMNALDPEMFDAIAAAGEGLKGNNDVRAVVLYGQGDNFCAGIDTSSFGEMIAKIDTIKKDMLNLKPGEIANPFQKPCYVWQELDVPVIASLHGVVYGGGAQLALAADFRIGGPDLKFSIMESKWGLIPDMGITQNLPKLLRADQAKELMMTARILNDKEADSLGLITRRADDPLSAAREFAAALAARAPQSVQGSKRLIEDMWAATPAEGLAREAILQADIIASPNQIEAVMANVQKRPPDFR